MNSFKLNCMSGAAAIAIALFASSGAQAALVPVNFTVTSSPTSTLPLSQAFQNAVQAQFSGSVVDRISGQFQYDPAANSMTATTLPQASFSSYALNSFSIGFFSGSQLLFGESVTPKNGSAISVYQPTAPSQSNPASVTVSINNGSFDSMLFSGAALRSVLLTLTDSSGSVITSTDLPTTAIWQGLPTSLSLTTVFGSGPTAQTQTQATVIGNLVVPEPAPLALMATGLLALGFAVRRNRNS